jgi:hypothetical protein
MTQWEALPTLASYLLIVEEIKAFCQCLRGVRVPICFLSNISKLVSIKDLSMFSYNSHDCHVMMMIFLKGHQTDAYQSTHHTFVLLFQYNFTKGDWS